MELSARALQQIAQLIDSRVGIIVDDKVGKIIDERVGKIVEEKVIKIVDERVAKVVEEKIDTAIDTKVGRLIDTKVLASERRIISHLTEFLARNFPTRNEVRDMLENSPTILGMKEDINTIKDNLIKVEEKSELRLTFLESDMREIKGKLAMT